MDDEIVYTARPRRKGLTVAALIRKLSKLDESLEVFVDTEARCDEYHLYPIEDVDVVPIESGMEIHAFITLHI